MFRLITLTINGGQTILVNPLQIACVKTALVHSGYPAADPTKQTQVVLSYGEFLYVEETPDDIKQLLCDAQY